MMNHDANVNLINQFYNAFAEGNSTAMTDCYHDQIVFEDPAFGQLKGADAKVMWKMLLERGGDGLKVTHKDVWANELNGGAIWEAHYPYGPQKRLVYNIIKAHFEFKDGKIIEHIDDFDLYRWSRKALGLPGYLLGWSGFMRQKIQKTTNGLLRKYQNR